jgi:LPXTG-motif cell wall-anchored protein
MSRAIAVFCAVLFVLSAAGTAGAKTTTQHITDFTGNASSHAVRITVGDLVVTVGGGTSNAAYQRAGDIRNRRADAKGNGIVIPGLADTRVACVPPKLTDSLVGLATPKSLEPVLTAKIDATNCAVSVANLPTASHASGEIDAAITLTQSLVGNVSAVNDVLSSVQSQLGSLPEPVRDHATNVISAIKDKLASDPVLEIKVAPNSGTVDATKSGIASASPGRAVTLSLLGGVIQIEIAVADASAAIVDGKPKASADVAFVHVKALDITTADPGDAIIDQKITAPQNLSILSGTPLQTSITTERGVTSSTCSGGLKGFSVCSSAVADAVSLKLLAAPLPTIGVDLVHTQALAAAKFGTKTRTDPTLPKTGAGMLATIVGGLVLAGGALAIRRRFAR